MISAKGLNNSLPIYVTRKTASGQTAEYSLTIGNPQRTERSKVTATLEQPLKQDQSEDEVGHIYRRPPRAGDRAYCGHLWTPDEAARVWMGPPLPDCQACVKARHEWRP